MRLLFLLLLAAPLAAFADCEAGVAAARAFDGASQYNVGLFYATGRGVAPSDVQADAWLTVALENGAKPTDLLGLLQKNMSARNLEKVRSLVDQVRRQCRLE